MNETLTYKDHLGTESVIDPVSMPRHEPLLLAVIPVIARCKYDGPSLCRRVYSSILEAGSRSLESTQDQQEQIEHTRLLVAELLQSEFHAAPRKHRMRLLKAVLTVQREGIYFSGMDASLEVHGWEHLHVLAKRLTVLEPLQVESNTTVMGEWETLIAVLADLADFVIRCDRSGAKDHHSSRPTSVRRVVSLLADAYPRGTGMSEVFVENGKVQALLDLYVRRISSLYALLATEDLLPMLGAPHAGTAFFRMISAHALRRITRENTVPSLANELEVDEILVTSDAGADVVIHVGRYNLLASSFSAVMEISDSEWQDCETIDVRFTGEPGYGDGIVREWIGELCLALFYGSGYFIPCISDPSVVHPNPEMSDDPETHSMMEFAGKLLGIGKRLGIPTGVHLSNAAVSMITMQALQLGDLYQLDPVLAASCAAIRRMNDPGDADVDLGSFVSSSMGCELFPGGADIQVRAHHRNVFADLLAECHLRGRHLTCMQSCHWIMRGMIAVLSSDFDNDDDVFTQMCGMHADSFNATFGGQGRAQELDVGQWELHTDICIRMGAWADDTGADADVDATKMDTKSPDVTAVIRCFFGVVACLDHEQRRTLLRFWTGTPSLPHGGFPALPGRLTLVVSCLSEREGAREKKGPGRLPSSHTCVRTLILPGYTNAEDMALAIKACLVSMDFDDSD